MTCADHLFSDKPSRSSFVPLAGPGSTYWTRRKNATSTNWAHCCHKLHSTARGSFFFSLLSFLWLWESCGGGLWSICFKLHINSAFCVYFVYKSLEKRKTTVMPRRKQKHIHSFSTSRFSAAFLALNSKQTQMGKYSFICCSPVDILQLGPYVFDVRELE